MVVLGTRIGIVLIGNSSFGTAQTGAAEAAAVGVGPMVDSWQRGGRGPGVWLKRDAQSPAGEANRRFTRVAGCYALFCGKASLMWID